MLGTRSKTSSALRTSLAYLAFGGSGIVIKSHPQKVVKLSDASYLAYLQRYRFNELKLATSR